MIGSKVTAFSRHSTRLNNHVSLFVYEAVFDGFRIAHNYRLSEKIIFSQRQRKGISDGLTYIQDRSYVILSVRLRICPKII